MTSPPLHRSALRREALYLLWGILFGVVSVPSIGTLYYREDIAIGYRQYLVALFDAETWFRATAYLLAPYLFVQLVRCAAGTWRKVRARSPARR